MNSEQTIINYSLISVPLGKMIACATDKGICLLKFVDNEHPDEKIHQIESFLNAKLIRESNVHLELLSNELGEYFKGDLQTFTIPLTPEGTEFQQKVWKELQNIQYGTTRSYEQQSLAMQMPLAIRAIANANGLNRIAIIIPCHRVIGKNGNLTGYASGLWRKKWLLEHEQKYSSTGNFQTQLF
jgi:AraC family transcriptional regulator of adaptative response/methylated-DNA-[protein]-cysteine methyltransferase